MELSYQTLQAILERYENAPPDGPTVTDHCGEYGEPGYHFRDGATTPLVVFGNYWCHCDDFDTLHSAETHHPRIWQQMEDQGVEFEWYDEWMIDHDAGKCYRTEATSCFWQPSAIYDDSGEILSPDSDIEDWIDYARDSTRRALMDRYKPALIEAGFEPVSERHETGFHQHMDADPVKVYEHERKFLDDRDECVFVVDETSQFYSTWSLYVRKHEEEE